MKKIYIDGSSGTTGLRLRSRLQNRTDIELIELPEQYRKNLEYRKDAMQKADAIVLCLPDAAAIEAAKVAPSDTVVLDTSTAHRTEKGWIYGLPQLGNEQKEAIKNSKRIAVPGCHACGFVTLVYPLVEAGIIKKDQTLHCFSLTGYSGGGKKMIEEYNNKEKSTLLEAPRLYGLSQQHKHLKEMKLITGIHKFPVFAPIVSNFYSGMQVMIPFEPKNAQVDLKAIINIYKNTYQGDVIKFVENADENGFLSAAAFSQRDCMQLTVEGNEERALLIARYDNLGKGASGAAVECLNLALGLEETLGLEL